jgi:hypothetical protein
VITTIINPIKSLAKIRKAWYNNSMTKLNTQGAGVHPTINEIMETSALRKQVAGSHYRQFPIQPIEFIVKNNLPFIEGNIIKYICRWQDKGGVEDLNKVIHYVELLKELKT